MSWRDGGTLAERGMGKYRQSNRKKVMLQAWSSPETLVTVDFILQIISRCDLILIQEVRDAKGEAVPALMKNLNRYKYCRFIPMF